ncbi:MAG: hypothetical protein AB1Z98_17320 [Nannocystaceae bacterium]
MQFSPEELDLLAAHRPHTATRWIEPTRHVEAFAVIDRGAGPGLGQVRLSAGADGLEALRLACRLARSTSIGAGLLGIGRAGAAVVVVDHPKLDRDTVGPLLAERLPVAGIRAYAGTGLDALAELEALVPVTAATLTELRAAVLDACLPALPLPSAAKRRALVLGAGPIGRDAAQALRARDYAVSLWDEDQDRASTLASELDITVHREPWPDATVELLVPCTPHALIDSATAQRLTATAIFGLVPRVLADKEATAILESRGVPLVPPLLGAAAELIALADAERLLDRHAALELLTTTAQHVLATVPGASARAIALAVARAQATAP